jgi:RNA polymerase sigma-70 factor (ECF subfamily)
MPAVTRTELFDPKQRIYCRGRKMMDLIEHVKSGNIEVFEELFHRYKNMVYKTAYLITGNGEEAEDVVQEVFSKVFHKASTFQSEKGSIGTWLHRITVNECNSVCRKNRPTSSLDGIDLKATDLDVLIEIVIEEERREVWQALRSLDEQLRLVLVLRYYQELSYEEIAERADIPLGTVKSRINRGLNSLRKGFERREVEP